MLFPSLFGSHDVNAWQLTDPYFDGSQSLNIYRSYMEQADGAPYIVDNEYLGLVGPASSYVLLPATDSSIQTKTLFGFTTAGYNLSGDDSSKRYHSAQTVFYFNLSNSSYISFGNVNLVGRYVLSSDSGSIQVQTVNCSLSYNQDLNPPNTVYVTVECPQVTYKGNGWSYKWADLNVGDLNTTNNVNSPYFVRYRDGGPFRISANVGQYIVSSSDNATELALEQITSQNQTIINQNQTIIDQNQTIIDQDNQDRQDLQNQVNDSSDTADDLSDDIGNASSSLLTIIGNFVNVIINPPQRDCVINGDMGHMNLGQIDLCQLSLPTSFQIISTLLMIGFIIPFAYSLISTFLSLLKGATQD